MRPIDLNVAARRAICVGSVCGFIAVAPVGAADFLRGDVDANGTLNISNVIITLGFMFKGEREPNCLESADADDSGELDLTDAIYVVRHLFLAGSAPPSPHVACGPDPTVDTLDCQSYSPCADAEFAAFVASFDLLGTVSGTGTIRVKSQNGWQDRFEGGPATAAELSRPHNAKGDDAGNIYISDKDAEAIRKVTPDGRIETVAGTNVAGNGDDSPGPGTQRQLNEPNGLWVRGDGTGYILDRTNEKVRRLSPEGVLTLAFRVPGLRTGRGLWVSEDEQLAYVSSETRLLRWTSSAGIENYTPAAVYKELGNLAVDSDGNVIVTDRKADRVYKVTPARSVVSLAGNGTNSGGGDGFPALETAYEACGSSTHAHAGDGDFFRSPGPKVSAARSVSMDSRGNVLITENDFGYVRIIYRKGTFALP